MTTSVIHRTVISTAVGLALGVFALSSCGSSADEVVEEATERAIEDETGGEADVDLRGDDGFSIETEEGSVSVDEDGNFVVVGDDGEVMTGDVDVDGDGSVDISSDEGDISFDLDEDGSGTFESDEGTVTFNEGEIDPSTWPPGVPLPTIESVLASTAFTGDDDSGAQVIGETDIGAATWLEEYETQLTTAGFERETYMETGDGVFASYSNGEWSVSVATNPGGDLATGVTVIVANV